MKNKKGAAPLVIGGVSVGAIIYLIFQIWAGTLIVNALEPEIDKALDQLNEKIVCIPEASSENYDICVDNLGKVIVNGNLSQSISISTDAGDFCSINSGRYEDKIVCSLGNLNKANEIYIQGVAMKKKIIATTKIASYITNLQNLKKPIKTGFWIFKKIKYIPIELK